MALKTVVMLIIFQMVAAYPDPGPNSANVNSNDVILYDEHTCGLAGGSLTGYQCLVFKQENKTWDEAIDICESDGGKILVPAYTRNIISFIRRHHLSSDSFWVGGFQNDPEKADQWYWMDGQRMQLDNMRTIFDEDNTQNCVDVSAGGYRNYNCDTKRRFICELGKASTESSGNVEFLIKQYSSTKYIGPSSLTSFDQAPSPFSAGDRLILHHLKDPHKYMAFDIIDEKWGYIRHIKSGKIVHPQVGKLYPNDGTKLVLHSHRRPWAMFALDQFQNRIVHRSGKFLKTDGLDVIISGKENEDETMEFQFMNPSKPNTEVLPYGYPIISGDWEFVWSVINPRATHTYTETVSTGRSKTKSISSDFKYGFEVENKSETSFRESVGREVGSETEREDVSEVGNETGHEESIEADTGGSVGFLGIGVSASISASETKSNLTSSSSSSSLSSSSSSSSLSSVEKGGSREYGSKNSLERELQESSSGTWNSEKSREFSFTVEAGNSVAVWQRVFTAERHGHKAVHLSNQFANTNDSRINPNNFEGWVSTSSQDCPVVHIDI